MLSGIERVLLRANAQMVRLCGVPTTKYNDPKTLLGSEMKVISFDLLFKHRVMRLKKFQSTSSSIWVQQEISASRLDNAKKANIPRMRNINGVVSLP